MQNFTNQDSNCVCVDNFCDTRDDTKICNTMIDEDMTTLDTTKNIAYMYICEVISNANYAIIYL